MSEETPKKKTLKLSKAQMKEIGLKQPTPDERDRSAEQDARVMPLVSYLLEKFGSHPFVFAQTVEEDHTPENESYDAFYSSFMVEAMSREIQLRDIPYVFALLKRAVEALADRSNTPQNQLRPTAAALEIMGLLGKEPTLMLNDTGKDDGKKLAFLYDNFYLDIVKPVFEKHGIQYNEMAQVFAIMSTMIITIEGKTTATIDGAQELAMQKLWNVEGSEDITLKQVHEKCIEKLDKTVDKDTQE